MRIPYLQASDSTDQEPGVTTPVQVTMDTTDGSAGITHSAGTVTILEAGVYFIVAAGQVGMDSNANVNCHLWLRKTDVDIVNSNTRAYLTEAAGTTVLVSQVVIRLAIGDTIKVYQSVDNTGEGEGLHHSAPAGEPAIPSIIFTMYKISD